MIYRAPLGCKAPALARTLNRTLFLLLPVCLCSGGNEVAVALPDQSLEDLMSMQVTSVARKKQVLSRAAAAVYVVTQDDIRRSGATSIPEALRMVPGLFVGQIDSSKWAISARGMAGRFSNKMLVLIDGRSIYTSLYSGVWWDQNDVMLEDVDRIEVIRGPGGTMWGANAVNGVINIITKPVANTQGVKASATAGTQDRGIGAVRYGGRIGEKIGYRIFSKYSNRGKQFSGGSPSNDDWSASRGGGRMEYEMNPRDLFTVQGDAFQGRSGQQIYPTFPAIDRRLMRSDTAYNTGGYGMGRWDRTYSDRSDLALQGYFYQENRSEGMATIQSTTLDLDFQHRIAAGSRNDVLWGFGIRTVHDQIGAGAMMALPLFSPASRTDELFSTFLQDDLALLPNVLTLTVGAKFQHNTYSGFNAQPNIRLLWTPSKRHSLWSAVSDAVRTPSRRDSDLQMAFPLPGPYPMTGLLSGSREFGNETVRAYEVGWRWQVNPRISFDVAGYLNSYRDLQFVEPGQLQVLVGPPYQVIVPFTFRNGRRETTRGAEISANWKMRRDLSLLLNYTYHDPGEDSPPPDSPRLGTGGFDQFPHHQSQSRVSWDFRRGKSIDLTFYAVSPMRDIAIPGYLRSDLRVATHAGENTEWSVGFQNMFRAHHAEFLAEDYVRTLQARRSIYLRCVWGQ
ncbi:MAG: TonB-dependent receptor plug domain-containing protein [Bryobacteraceae bacterium]